MLGAHEADRRRLNEIQAFLVQVKGDHVQEQKQAAMLLMPMLVLLVMMLVVLERDLVLVLLFTRMVKIKKMKYLIHTCMMVLLHQV
jgi:hypothetical protein